RFAAGKLRLKAGPVDLREVIAAAIVAVRPAAQAKGIRLESIHRGAARRVWGDGGRLQQVVWNLLSNAIKFTPEGGGVESRAGPALEGLRVLVVDDEADARESLTAVLEQCGAVVTAVASAREALGALAHQRPDILVSDIGMPEEDGYALIEKVRVLDARHGGRIPAVALTAYAAPEDRQRALDAGYELHVPKPVTPEELVTAVANLSGRRAA